MLSAMTTFTETFTGGEDRARVLTEILRLGSAVPGTTLVAHVERATLAVLAVRSLPTPAPVFDDHDCFVAASIQRLSDELCDVAQGLAPTRTWTGRGWSAMTGELVTVVCRTGEAAVSAVEVQYGWGWRYSNHFTAALHGDVYVVTPAGWASLLGEWSGDLPALPTDAVSLGGVPAVQDAERILADASQALLQPDHGECLLCYVHRMLLDFGCNTRLRFATRYRDVRAPRATALERRLARLGGFCDCEILLNGYELRLEHHDSDPWSALVDEFTETADLADDPAETEQPSPGPLPCTGVRAGSTQPCSLWWPRRGW